MSRAGGSERAVDLLRRLAGAPRPGEARPAFLDGLLLGAMVGAAIAGSTVWSRRRARRRTAGSGRPVTGELPPGAG